jgi:hypothetical protein
MGAGSSFPFGLLGHAKLFFANGAVSGAESGRQTTEHEQIVLTKLAERSVFEIVREHEDWGIFLYQGPFAEATWSLRRGTAASFGV